MEQALGQVGELYSAAKSHHSSAEHKQQRLHASACNFFAIKVITLEAMFGAVAWAFLWLCRPH